MTVTRSHMQIIYDVLHFLKGNGEANGQKICTYGKMTHQLFSKYMGKLMDTELVVKQATGYHIMPKGIEFLETIDKYKVFLKDFDLDI